MSDHERRLSDFAVTRIHDPSSDDHVVWLGIRSQAVHTFGHERITHLDAKKTRELYDYLRFLYGDDDE